MPMSAVPAIRLDTGGRVAKFEKRFGKKTADTDAK